MTTETQGATMTTPGPLDPDGPDLTADEVAALLRVSARSVRRWANEGEFPGAILIHNSKWLFPQRVLIAYRESKER